MNVSVRVLETIAVVTLEHPPVNSLSFAVRQQLFETLHRLRSAADIRAVVLHGAGRGFCAGADLHELGTPAASAAPGLSSHVHPAIEGCGKPVIAALHGLAIGGGLETALACHYRIAHADTKIALPEVRRGLTPLSGTQRLPRLLGVARSVEMIIHGEIVSRQ